MMTRAIWRVFLAFAFYPAALALMIWLWWTKQHWSWGALVILSVLWLDPIWRVMARNILSWRPKK